MPRLTNRIILDAFYNGNIIKTEKGYIQLQFKPNDDKYWYSAEEYEKLRISKQYQKCPHCNRLVKLGLRGRK